MNQREEINWFFIEKYYDYLKKKLMNIDYYQTIGAWNYTLLELKQIFIHINGEIYRNKDTREHYKEFRQRFKKVQMKIDQLELLRLKTTAPSTIRTKKLSAMSFDIRDEIDELYADLFLVISMLGMLAPRVSKEDRIRGEEVLTSRY